MYVCMYVYIYIYMIRVYVYVYIYIYREREICHSSKGLQSYSSKAPQGYPEIYP